MSLCDVRPGFTWTLFFWSLQVLLPPVVACVEDTFYKITSEALLVTQQLVRVMRPLEQTGGFDPKPFVKEVRWLRCFSSGLSC